MALKYKFSFKDFKNISLNDFKIYFFSLFKVLVPKKKIRNLKDLETFIQNKSAWVTQVTLYGYLKTRMGTRYVLHFDNEEFLASINKAKWNIYIVALQDLTFFTFSYIYNTFNFKDLKKAEDIYISILNKELENKIPREIFQEGIENFQKKMQGINWNIYHNNYPFNDSALSLYTWAPIAEELKKLDRTIVLNSVILKWDVVKKEFYNRIIF
tara:strand:+ start:81 stop:716 length:636 start_codon:yes stop_codon:yes gene_type:complete